MSAPAPLPAHRLALRVALGAAVVGALGAALAIPILLRTGLGHPGELELMLVLLPVGIGAASALALGSGEVARHTPPLARPLVVLGVGSVSALLTSGAVAWVWTLLEGDGTQQAWKTLGTLAEWCLEHPGRALPLAGAFLLPTLTLGCLRSLEVPLGWGWQAPAGGLAGLAAYGLLCAALGPPEASDRAGFLSLFLLLPGLVAPGAALAERAELRLFGDPLPPREESLVADPLREPD